MESTFAKFIMQQTQESVHRDLERAAGCPTLRVESFGKVPAMEFRQLTSGQIFFRYAIDDASAHLGFDEVWRQMSAWDQRQTLLMGGGVAEWLKSLPAGGSR